MNLAEFLNDLIDNPYIYTILFILVILYANIFTMELSDNVMELFENPIIKIIIFVLIGYLGNNNPWIAIIIGILFILVLNKVTEKKITNELKQI